MSTLWAGLSAGSTFRQTDRQVMDFSTVVELARQLHVHGRPRSDVSCIKSYDEVVETVYGRICSSGSHPERLTDTPGRKTAFVFGPDAISSVILRSDSYSAIFRLGFTKDYIKHELVEKKCQYWLLLFQPTQELKNLFVLATWDGVTHIVNSMYPNVYPDLMQHLSTLKNTPFEDFEKEAGFTFLECRRNISGTFPDKPPYYNYDFYCTLPKPRTALQVRLFLYCEIRLLEMFRGDGYASATEPDSVPSLEYLCPNLRLSEFDEEHLAVLPMTHICIPD